MSRVLRNRTGVIGDFHTPNWYGIRGYITDDDNSQPYKITGRGLQSFDFVAGNAVTFNVRRGTKRAFNVRHTT